MWSLILHRASSEPPLSCAEGVFLLPEVNDIKQLPLASVNDNMTLAQDVYDLHDRVLVTAGTQLRREIIALLQKHEVKSVWVKHTQTIKSLPQNREITAVQNLIGAATRRKMIQTMQNAFRQRGSIAAHLPYMREAIDDVIKELSCHDHLLIYLTDIRKRSDYLYGHCVDVGLFAIVIGMAMGLSKEDIYILGIGGLLHDYGKTTISDAILEKNGPLTPEEFNLVKTHASAGYNILRSETKVDSRIALMALQHHERPDGRGYPWGIKEDEIHPLAKIIAVADVYDALTTDRVYRPAVAVYEAIRTIQVSSGTQFDKKVVETFCNVTVPFYVGSAVKLSNGVAGAVLRINSSNPSRPVIWTREGIINLLHDCSIDIVAVI
jgi:HD-GYP domain-containing protein (c-di-GMP phosphodiesterase class II)